MATFIGNSCLAWELCKHIGSMPYNTPFVSSLILEDEYFIKLCLNLEHYINIKPIFIDNPSKDTKWYKETGSEWYVHPSISLPYPVMKLDDIEIHWIHETDQNKLLDKFNRRADRLRKLMENKPDNIVCFWTFGQMFNEYKNIDEYKDIISRFMSCKYRTIFVGPDQFKHLANNNNSFYYEIPNWNNENSWNTWHPWHVRTIDHGTTKSYMKNLPL